VRREKLPSLEEVKKHCMDQISAMRSDHLRALNPTPFKVSNSCHYYWRLVVCFDAPCTWFNFLSQFSRFLVTV
jgi:hypothetical protein